MKLRWPWWAYLAAVGASCAAVGLLWWLLIGRADKANQQAAEAKVGQVVAEKRAEAAVDAGKLIERHYDRTTIIKEQRDNGLEQIRQAENDAAAGNAARRALCLLDAASYRDDPACQL